MRHNYLVSYDISDATRLRRIFHVVRDFGDRLQLSVFLCQLSEREVTVLRERLHDQINDTEDQVLIVRLAPVNATDGLDDRIQHLGRPPALPSNEPMVY